MAAISPAGSASTIEGTTATSLSRAIDRNLSVESTFALGSIVIWSTPIALYQNGEISRIDGSRSSASPSESSRVQ